MTIPDQSRITNSLGNDTTPTYPYTFRIKDDDDLGVYLLPVATGIQVKLLNTDFTVNGPYNQDAGGTITITNAAYLNAGNLPTGDILVIIGERVIDQTTSFKNQSKYLPAKHENSFDNDTVIAQQQAEQFARTLHVAVTNNTLSTELPALLPYDLLWVNAAGDAIVSVQMNEAISQITSDDITEGIVHLFLTAAERALIAQNAADIIVNATNISTNTGNISTNTTNIAANTSLLADTVTQAEAEAGTSTTNRRWTAERINQAIQSLSPSGPNGVTASGTLDLDKLVVGNGVKGLVTTTVSPSDIVANNSKISYTDAAAVAANTAKVTNATHTGDATGDTALTLATVNSNVGSFTNADITVNAKGLITAASNGTGGTVNYTVDNFVDGVDFTAGTSTTITLSVSPASENNVQIYMNGVYQQKDTYSLAGAVITFDAAIPNGVTEIEAISGVASTIGTPSDSTVSTAKIVDNAVTSAKLADSGIFNEFRAPDIILQDQKSTTTSGGTFTAGTQTRTLNTEVLDVNGDCSLSSNQFTLAAGTYYLKASAPAYKVDRHKLILYNTTGSVAIDSGTSERSGSSGDASTRAVICTKFTIAASQALELRHYAQTTSTTLGFGLATSDGSTEIYSQVEIWRLS